MWNLTQETTWPIVWGSKDAAEAGEWVAYTLLLGKQESELVQRPHIYSDLLKSVAPC